jgi:pyrroloquinoline quinone biosynthesis protein D
VIDEFPIPLTARGRPVINAPYRLRWEEGEGCYVLSSSTGTVRLNESAAEILKRCDGSRSAAQLVDELKALYAGAGGEIDAGVRRFLELARARGWIRYAGA